MQLQIEITLGLYYLVVHCVTLVTSVTFVTHVTSVTSVTCSIRKFHQSKYISTNATASGNQTETTSPFEEDIIHSDLISDPVEESSEEEATEGTEESHEPAGSSDTVPQIVDDGLDSNTRRSNRSRNPPKLLTFKDFKAARNWQEMANC